MERKKANNVCHLGNMELNAHSRQTLISHRFILKSFLPQSLVFLR